MPSRNPQLFLPNTQGHALVILLRNILCGVNSLRTETDRDDYSLFKKLGEKIQ